MNESGVTPRPALRCSVSSPMACGRAEALLDVAGLEHARRLVRVIRPDAGETIGLQLHRDLQPIRVDLARALLRGAHLIRRAEQRLHVMADLVADDVRRREIAGAAHARELVEERRVEIDAPVAGAVERPRGRARVTARRLHGAGEQRELGRLIGLTLLRGTARPTRPRCCRARARRSRWLRRWPSAACPARRSAPPPPPPKQLQDGVRSAEDEQRDRG